MNILLGITIGTQKGQKIIVKVVIGPFKGPKLSCVGCDNLGPKMSKTLIISMVII